MASICGLELAADHGEQLLMAQMGSRQASRKRGKMRELQKAVQGNVTGMTGKASWRRWHQR